jgi:hypothetical protein
VATDRDAREALFARICDDLDAAPVQHLGKNLTIWRLRRRRSRHRSRHDRHAASAKTRAPPRGQGRGQPGQGRG